MKPYAFGVDIGGTTIKLGLFQTQGMLMDVWEITTRKEDNGVWILRDIAAAVFKKLEEKQIPKDQVEGIGMGVPGPIGPDGTVFKCVNLGWDVFNVEQEMQQLTGFKVKAGNDANVAALGEMWQGGGKGYRDQVMVTLGTGVGGGVIVDGKILAGVNGAGGEIGHLTMCEEELETCGCGKHGCLEQYASAPGVVRLAVRYLESHPQEMSVLRSIEGFDAKHVFDAARNGDAAAKIVVEQFGKMLGKGLALISCVTNPEAFVIGGGMSKAGEILIETVKKHYQKYAFHASRDTKICLATLGNQAGIYGSVKMVIG